MDSHAQLTTRPRRRGLWTAVAVAAVAFIAAIGVGAPVIASVVRAIASPAIDVPSREVVHLDAGDHLIYAFAGRARSFGNVSVQTDDGVRLSLLEVTGPDGRRVQLSRPDGQSTLTRNDERYVEIAEFRADRAGDYTITSDSARPTSILVVADPFEGHAAQIVAAVAAATVGGMASFAVLIILIVSTTRRPAAPRPPAPASHLPPPPPPPAPPAPPL